MEDTYTYWFFLIKSEYAKYIPIADIPDRTATLFAYTNKKSLVKLFLKLHKKEAFVIKKIDISKDAVNILASRHQNDIIRKIKIRTKDSKYNIIDIEIALTENESMIIENTCFSMSDSLFTCAWVSNENLSSKYKEALDVLGYTKVHKSLIDGESVILPIEMDMDQFGSMVNLYSKIMEVNL